MKKKAKRFLSCLFAAMMVLSTTAMVTEAAAPPTEPEYSVNALVDDTFTMGSTHRGADRTYSTSSLYVRAQITDTSGNAASGGSVTISLNDYNGNFTAWSVPANGKIYGKTFYIVPGRMYYLTYVRVNTTKTLKLHIWIN